MADAGLSDEELLKQLSAIYGKGLVAGVAKELAAARTAAYTSEDGLGDAVESIQKRFTCRMQDLTVVKMLRRRVRYFTDLITLTKKLPARS